MSLDSTFRHMEDAGSDDDRCEYCGGLLFTREEYFKVVPTDTPTQGSDLKLSSRFVVFCPNKECSHFNREVGL